MNGWIIAWLVWYAAGFAVVLTKLVDGETYIKISYGGLALGATVTMFLLYMGGAFS